MESKKPNEQVKKSELQAFMRDNRIEVVEVVKGTYSKEVNDLFKRLDSGLIQRQSDNKTTFK